MKNIILNSVQLASSLKLDASYCFNLPPQYKGGFRGFFLKNGLILLGLGLILGVLSCQEEAPNRGLAPKIEDNKTPTTEPTEPENKVVAVPTGRKIIQLNTAKFTVKDGPKGNEKTVEVLLKDGVPKLQIIYAYAKPESELNKILEKTRPFLTQDVMDKEAFDKILADYQAIKPKHLESESFVNFVNALALASQNAVAGIETPQPPKIQIGQPPVPQNNVMTKTEPLTIPIWLLYTLLAAVFLVVGYFGMKKFKQKSEATEADNFKEEAERLRLQREKEVQREREKELEKNLAESERLRAEEGRKRKEAERKVAELEANKNQSPEVETPKNKEKMDSLDLNLDEKSIEPVVPIAAPPPVEIAYLSLPMNEMIFNNASKSLVAMVGQSFYEFTINAEGTTATFKFWNNPDAVKHAIDKPHSHIEPACEPQNARDSYATKITTVEVGHAELQDNKWIVTSKAKIRYEL